MNKLLILMLLVIFLFPVLVQSESYSDNNQSLAENTDSFVKNTRYIANANPCRGDILASDTCSSGSLFEQLPLDCDGSWAVVTSDTDLEYFVYDDYEAFGSISNIQWWGIDLHYGAKSWEECDEDPATFNIHFCPDNGSGAPDEANPVSVYTITVVHAPPAVCVLAGIYSVWEWYTELDPVCNLQQGWVGIQGVGNGDTCVFMWYNSRENVFGYNSWQNNGYTTYQQAFCLNGILIDTCVICDVVNHTPYVSPNNGIIQWDLTVTNCGSQPITNVWGEIIPTNTDCNGFQYDFNITRLVVNDLTPSSSFTDYYYYRPGIVGPSFNDVALNIYVGTGINNYFYNCCFEFAFFHDWGQSYSTANWEYGEWGERDNAVIPSTTSLGDNYPNPFNTLTSIPINLGSPGEISLSIYNLSGQHVERLIKGNIEAGQHSVTWDASTYSSGIYFYRLSTENKTITKRMTLLK